MALGSKETGNGGNNFKNFSVELKGLAESDSVKLVISGKDDAGNYITLDTLTGRNCNVGGQFKKVLIKTVDNYHRGASATFASVLLVDNREQENYWLKFKLGTQVSKAITSLLASADELGAVSFSFRDSKNGGFVDIFIKNNAQPLRYSMKPSSPDYKALTDDDIAKILKDLIAEDPSGAPVVEESVEVPQPIVADRVEDPAPKASEEEEDDLPF